MTLQIIIYIANLCVKNRERTKDTRLIEDVGLPSGRELVFTGK